VPIEGISMIQMFGKYSNHCHGGFAIVLDFDIAAEAGSGRHLGYFAIALFVFEFGY